VTVFDDRAEFADRRRFPDADDLVVQPFDQMLKDFPIGSNAFVVIVTRGHLHDHQIVRQVLKNPPRYIGMIGSRHKKGIIFKALREEGFSEDLIQSIHTPIGLDIGAETPEEIAVSIVAELIQVRGS
jgi:xanthine dehydrogenase accessory factor